MKETIINNFSQKSEGKYMQPDFFTKINAAKKISSWASEEDLASLPKEYFQDPLFVMCACFQSKAALALAPHLKEDFDFASLISSVYSIGSMLGTDLLANKDFVRNLLMVEPNSLQFVSDTLKNDPEMVEIVLRKEASNMSKNAFQYIGEELRKDAQLMTEFISIVGAVYKLLPEEQKENINLLKQALRLPYNEIKLSDIPVSLRSNIEILQALKSIKKEDIALLPDSVLNNRDFWLYRACKNQSILEFLPAAFQEDNAFKYLKAASIDGYKIKSYREEHKEIPLGIEIFLQIEDLEFYESYDFSTVPKELWEDIDFVRAMAIYVGGTQIEEFLAERFKKDRDFALLVYGTKMNPYNPPVEYQNDRDFARVVAENHAAAIRDFSEELRNDIAFMSELILSGLDVLQYCPPEIQADSKLVEYAIKRNPDALQYATPEVQQELWEVAFVGNINSYQVTEIAENLSFAEYNKESALRILRMQPELYPFFTEEIRSDIDIVRTVLCLLQAANGKGDIYKAFPKVLSDSEELMALLLTTNAEDGIEFMSPTFKNDKEIMKACVVHGSGSLFQFASEQLKKDVSYLIEIKNCSIAALDHVSDELKALVSAMEVHTPICRNKQIRGRIIPRERIGESLRYDIFDIQLHVDNQVSFTAEKMKLTRYGWRNWQSYLLPDESNSLVMVGDFLFYTSYFTPEFKVKKEGNEQSGHRVYLIDYHTNPSAKIIDTQYENNVVPTSMHLLSEGSPPPKGVGFAREEADDLFYAVTYAAGGKSIPSGYQGIVEVQDNVCHVIVDKQSSACGGAARVFVDGFGWRWLIPDPQGKYSWENIQKDLQNRTHEEEWTILKERYLEQATEIERANVQQHFADVGSEALKKEVLQYFNV